MLGGGDHIRRGIYLGTHVGGGGVLSLPLDGRSDPPQT